jgi:DDE superfamily endonuclease
MKDITKSTPVLAPTSVLTELFKIIEGHRSVFKQERTFRRVVLMCIGMICALAAHTVTQGIAAVGCGRQSWSAWYRLFGGKRFSEAELSKKLFEQVLESAPRDGLFVIGNDATHIQRSSKTMPGTGWARAMGTAVFMRGLARAQRFVTCVWFPPIVKGFTRAIPLRFLPAPTPKAVKSAVEPQREWQVAAKFQAWVREELNLAGRIGQWVLSIGDGSYDVSGLWNALPDRVVMLVRTAKNRVLFELPGKYIGRGRKPYYGARAPAPSAHAHERSGWKYTSHNIRGRMIKLRWKLRGCYLRQGAPNQPVYLLVIGGAIWTSGKRKVKRHARPPVYYLFNAIKVDGHWQPPIDIQTLIEWAWQRWELEVTHRDMKAGFGVGDMQCWGMTSTFLATQWCAWLFSVMLLAGYRAWGWTIPVTRTFSWSRPAQRWSFNTLWRSLRAELWGLPEFQALSSQSTATGPNLHTRLAFLCNAALSCARA